jgi:hypothetical protein
MRIRWMTAALLVPATVMAQAGPSREDVLAAMRRAATFYVERVATEGGYHFFYAEDLSYGRSESAEGPTQVEYQRDGTPLVTLAYLDAFEATGDRLFLEAARKAGGAYLRGQLCSGGWDYLVELDPAKRKPYQYRADDNCGADKRGVTNLDDNVTQSAVRVMMRLDRALGFQDAAIHAAVTFALDTLIAAQYPIGAWPQRFATAPDHARFPVKRASYPATWDRTWPGPTYQQHYTFNDNTLADAIDMMLEAARIYREPRYLASAEKGGQFILLAQMPEPQPAWAQQYDAEMHPAWARVFEPPAVTAGESQGIIRLLMVLHRETGDPKYLEPIPRALAYLRRSVLPPADHATEARRRFDGPVMARFYELQTNRPLYITKGTRMDVAGLGSRLVDGYQLSYDDRSVITHYGVLTSGAGLDALEQDYASLLASDPASRRRADRLTGLSPWSERPRPARSRDALAATARELIASMDARGAWLTEGTIGKADRLVFLYAARDMVLRVGRGRSDGSAGTGERAGDRVIRLGENDTVEIFQGSEPPRERIISSEVFARNLQALAEYYRASAP